MNAPTPVTGGTAVTHSASVARHDLKAALAFARMAVERRNTIPVLGTVLLSFSDGRLAVTGTNLDMECRFEIDAEASTAFSFCVSPQHLSGVVCAGSGDCIGFEVGSADTTCRVRCGTLEAAFRSVLPAEDFPVFADASLAAPDGAPLDLATIPERVMHRLLDDTLFAVSTEETRYYLNGVYLHRKDDGTLAVAATDGHRLAIRRTGIDFPAGLTGILPSGAARTMHRILRAGGNATLTLCGNHLIQRLTSDAADWQITYKPIDGKYPDFVRVVPSKQATWHVPLSLGMIQQPMSFLRGARKPVRFDLARGKMCIRLEDFSDVQFDILGAKGDGSVGFNLTFLRDILLRHSPAVISSAGRMEPALVTTEDPDLTHVIMPLRV